MEQDYKISTNNSQNQWQNDIESGFWDIDENDEEYLETDENDEKYWETDEIDKEYSDILGKTLDLGENLDLGKTLDNTKFINELEQTKDDSSTISEVDLGEPLDKTEIKNLLGETLDETEIIDEPEQTKYDHYDISEVDYKPSDLLWGTLYETKFISEPEQKINGSFDRREFGPLSIVHNSDLAIKKTKNNDFELKHRQNTNTKSNRGQERKKNKSEVQLAKVNNKRPTVYVESIGDYLKKMQSDFEKLDNAMINLWNNDKVTDEERDEIYKAIRGSYNDELQLLSRIYNRLGINGNNVGSSQTKDKDLNDNQVTGNSEHNLVGYNMGQSFEDFVNDTRPLECLPTNPFENKLNMSNCYKYEFQLPSSIYNRSGINGNNVGSSQTNGKIPSVDNKKQEEGISSNLNDDQSDEFPISESTVENQFEECRRIHNEVKKKIGADESKNEQLNKLWEDIVKKKNRGRYFKMVSLCNEMEKLIY